MSDLILTPCPNSGVHYTYPTSGYLCDDVMDRNGPDLYTMIQKIESWAGPAVPWNKVLNDDDFSEENWPMEINRLYFLGW